MLRVKSGWAGELSEDCRLIRASHMRFIAAIGKVVIGHTGIRTLSTGGLIQGVKRHFCAVVGQALSSDVQPISAAT